MHSISENMHPHEPSKKESPKSAAKGLIEAASKVGLCVDVPKAASSPSDATASFHTAELQESTSVCFREDLIREIIEHYRPPTTRPPENPIPVQRVGNRPRLCRMESDLSLDEEKSSSVSYRGDRIRELMQHYHPNNIGWPLESSEGTATEDCIDESDDPSLPAVRNMCLSESKGDPEASYLRVRAAGNLQYSKDSFTEEKGDVATAECMDDSPAPPLPLHVLGAGLSLDALDELDESDY